MRRFLCSSISPSVLAEVGLTLPIMPLVSVVLNLRIPPPPQASKTRTQAPNRRLDDAHRPEISRIKNYPILFNALRSSAPSLCRPPIIPPSTTRSWPLMEVDSSLARKTAAQAISSASPARGIGCALLKTFVHDRHRLLGGVGRQVHTGRDQTGRDRIDADAGLSQLHGGTFGEMDHCSLGGAVIHVRKRLDLWRCYQY